MTFIRSLTSSGEKRQQIALQVEERVSSDLGVVGREGETVLYFWPASRGVLRAPLCSQEGQVGAKRRQILCFNSGWPLNGKFPCIRQLGNKAERPTLYYAHGLS